MSIDTRFTVGWQSVTAVMKHCEPIPARVTYEALRNHFVHTRENLLPGVMTESPSDCVWIVPAPSLTQNTKSVRTR